MVDSVKRKLRDGVADGEQAPVILVRDTVSTQGGISLLKDILLGSICDYVAKGLAQAKVVVVVAISESPESYAKIPSAADQDESNRVRNWLRIIDCYTDRLGWEGKGDDQSSNDAPVGGQNIFSLCRDIRNLDGLLSLILEAGRRGTAPLQTQDKFVVLFDSISLLLRYHSLHALASFLSTLRSYNETSALAYLLHSDLHTPQITSALEYLSSTTIAVGPHLELPSILDPNAKTTQLESFDKGLLKIRQKRRNGRVREQTEMFSCGADGFTFAPVESDPIDSRSGKFTVPKVQFNLSLTERELEDRSKVILPFEHQGDGRERRIYDGRENSKTVNFVSRSRDSTLVLGPDSGANPDTGFGAIHYLRDSDDERPDSDEDPDDDLDI